LTRVFVAKEDDEVIGYAITYLIRSGSQWNPVQAYHKGALAALIIDPAHRNKGVGTALHSQALEYLGSKVKESFSLASPRPEKSSIQLGSTFPRIFPGVPDGPEFELARNWFQRRGWAFGSKLSIDLYQSFEPGRRDDLEQLMQKAVKGGFTFGNPKQEDVEKLYQLQKDNFDSYTVGPDRLSSKGRATEALGLARHVPALDRCRAP
jgi:beta-N-acetylhexosaminidase